MLGNFLPHTWQVATELEAGGSCECLLMTWFLRQRQLLPQTEHSCRSPLCDAWRLRRLEACVKPLPQVAHWCGRSSGRTSLWRVR